MMANTVVLEDGAKPDNAANRKLVYFFVGLAIIGLSFLLPLPEGLKPAAMATLAVMAVTVLWWVTETLPVPVTAMMVPVWLHMLNVVPLRKAVTESFGDNFVPFLIGVLALSVAFNRSGLGKRLTYILLSVSGTRVKSVIGVYLFVSFALSMFITDVAVVAMMLPVAIGLVKSAGCKPGESNFGRAMMMAIMFGSTLGGIGTPSGVTANIITMGFLQKNANIAISFLDWTLLATPMCFVCALICWWLITKIFPPEMQQLPFGKETIQKDLAEMGAWKREEISTFVVFLLAVVFWLTGEWTRIPIALVSLAILGFLSIPSYGAVKTWGSLEKDLEWGALLLVIGGFCLGIAASSSGLATWVAQNLLAPMGKLPVEVQPLAVTFLVAIDSLGFSSFGAAASVNVPFVISYAQQHGFPVLSLALAAGFASSTHFILVTESPSFVLPYAYGYFSFKDMFKIGVIMTLICAVVFGLGFVVIGLPAGVVIQ
jgi:sodium-dependent dicarboxylate transporter 2/3/5